MEISLEHPNTQHPNAKHSLYFPTPLGLVSLLSVEVITDNDKKYIDNVKDDNDKDNVKDNDIDNNIEDNNIDDENNNNDNNDNNDNNNKKQQGKTTVRLMICTPFAKVVATLKVEQGIIKTTNTNTNTNTNTTNSIF